MTTCQSPLLARMMNSRELSTTTSCSNSKNRFQMVTGTSRMALQLIESPSLLFRHSKNRRTSSNHDREKKTIQTIHKKTKLNIRQTLIEKTIQTIHNKTKLNKTNLDFWISDNILLQEFITKCSRDWDNTTHTPPLYKIPITKQ